MILYRIAKLLEDREQLADRMQNWDGNMESFIRHIDDSADSRADVWTASPEVPHVAALAPVPENRHEEFAH
jgi:hypothetical protein